MTGECHLACSAKHEEAKYVDKAFDLQRKYTEVTGPGKRARDAGAPITAPRVG